MNIRFDPSPQTFRESWYGLKISLISMWNTRPLRKGMILLFVVAPMAQMFYMVFPEDGFGEYLFKSPHLIIRNFLEPEDWYYGQLYNFARACREAWTPLFILYSLYLLYPAKYPIKYLVSVPFGYYLALLIQRITVKDLQDYQSALSPSLLTVSIVFSIALLVWGDRRVSRGNHHSNSSIARILGLIKLPDKSLSDRERIRILRKEAEKLVKEGGVW